MTLLTATWRHCDRVPYNVATRSRATRSISPPTFKTLKTGLTYMAFGEAIVPAKELSVQVQNFDYNRYN